MNKIKNIFTQYKKYILIGAPILLIVLYFLFSGSGAGVELYTVAKADVEQSVVLSGKVQTSDRADLGFASSGRLSQIAVKNNQKVSEGQVLAQLEIGDLLADLKIKQANSRVSDVDLNTAKEELDKVTTTENSKVANAYRTLLSEDLIPKPNSNDYGISAPTVSGIYDGAEGTYKITIDKENVTLPDYRLLIFGLEKKVELIEEESSTPLGTRGLYISFPDNDFAPYLNTTWYLDIPNKSSSSYLANYNAYSQAKNERDLAIKKADSTYQKLLSEQAGGETGVAQAEIQKINAEIRKNTIYAPFTGVVTNIEKEVGENASVGERVISILGEDTLEVVLQVSELDVSRLAPGAQIKITLDAFPNETFMGTLKTINSRETEVDGVPVYEGFVELLPDMRIKTGMSANGTIIVAEKKGVIAIPNYIVKKSGTKDVVMVRDAKGKDTEREVTLGLMGSDSMVEIISGLNEGDQVVFASKK
ncbi:MAG: efflux RND transporter periplasmic adaptor subunit [Candidatus Pacebacteria bacterium]|nr:efflux RND transporter periplasmic adaptor subunit [Candidatus Paceibacterota bacterium]